MTTEEITARDELMEVAEEYRLADETEKKAKGEKDTLKPAYLDLITEVVTEEVELAQKSVTVTNEEVEDFGGLDAWMMHEHPGWVVLIETLNEGQWELLITENAKLVKYEFVTPEGYKMGRTVRMVGETFETERLYKDMAEAMTKDQISRPLGAEIMDCITTEIVTTYSLDAKKAKKLMETHPQTVPIFQKYAFPGTPQVAVLPIKLARTDS